MSITVRMPAPSPTIEEGALSKWLVNPGDRVSAGDVVADIETDKAATKREAADQGVAGGLLVAEGVRDVNIGRLIALHRAIDESSAIRQSSIFLPPPPRRHRRGSEQRR